LSFGIKQTVSVTNDKGEKVSKTTTQTGDDSVTIDNVTINKTTTSIENDIRMKMDVIVKVPDFVDSGELRISAKSWNGSRKVGTVSMEHALNRTLRNINDEVWYLMSLQNNKDDGYYAQEAAFSVA